MKIGFLNLHRRVIASILIPVSLHMAVGCGYYNIKKPASSPSVEAVELVGDPDQGIPPLKKGSAVLVQIKSGITFKKYFIKYDSTYVYLGSSGRRHDQLVERKEITAIRKTGKNEKYFILHSGELAWHLKDPYMAESRDAIVGKLESLPAEHLQFRKGNPKPGKSKAYGNYVEPSNEVHLYSTGSQYNNDQEVTVKLASLEKIEVYEFDKGTSTANVILGTIAVVAVIAVVAAISKSSCPFVYTKEGEYYQFRGEIYGGALFPSLERDDFLPLPGFTPKDGIYELKISNELLEKQYTNLAQLVIVDHQEGTTALMDKSGRVQIVAEPKTPISAISERGYDHRKAIEKKDSNYYEFNYPEIDRDDRSDLVLTFQRPQGVDEAKLILNAKNSYWMDYVYGKFTEQFGTGFNQYIEYQKTIKKEKLVQWSNDQDIPLAVYLETATGWEKVDYFNVIGPLAPRDIIMPIDLRHATGDSIRIKLETGFRFWDVDYAALDFTSIQPRNITHLTPASAFDENMTEVSELLSQTDDKYLDQPEVGNEATIRFFKTPTGAHQSIFLHTRGYYEHIREYKNDPNWLKIYSFTRKGSFTRFAREQFDLVAGSKDIFPIAEIDGSSN